MPSTPPPPPPQAAPQTSWPAIYYDGKSSARQSVTIHLQPSGLDLLWPNGTHAWWPSREIRQTQGTYANEPIRLEHTAGRLEAMPETLVIEDPAFLAALTRVVREQPHVASQTMSPSRHFQRIILAAIVSVVGLVSLSVWGIPLLAELAAPFVPMTFETHLGEVVLKEVAPEVDRCTDPQLQQALETIITRLATKTRGSDYRFHLTVVDQPAMNAIALPGGSIVLYRKLLQQTDTPDELAGVLAHEMQHIVHQHGTKALLHDLGLSLLIGAVMGDVSGMTAIAVQAGRTMTTLRHSRDAEEEADRDGMILLLAAHLDPAGMIRFFDTLQQEQGGPAIPQYLSTHPDTEARIAHLKDLAAGLPVQVESLPLTEEWHALRDRCRDEPKG